MSAAASVQDGTSAKFICIKMAANQDLPKFKGVLKRDVDAKWAELTIRINNLKKSRDAVAVTYPTDVNESLVVTAAGTEMYNRRLPAALVLSKCKHEVTSGEKGKVVIRLRKAHPGRWIDRWSPRRDLPTSGSSAITTLDGVTDASHCSPLTTDNPYIPIESKIVSTAVALTAMRPVGGDSSPIVTFPDSDDENRRL